MNLLRKLIEGGYDPATLQEMGYPRHRIETEMRNMALDKDDDDCERIYELETEMD